MDINPLQGVSAVAASVNSGSSAPKRVPSPNLQELPKAESRQTAAAFAETPFPQTEVKVHPDTSTGMDVLIYEFRDSKSGSLMYQIPSQQLLGLMQSIQHQLEHLSSITPKTE